MSSHIDLHKNKFITFNLWTFILQASVFSYKFSVASNLIKTEVYIPVLTCM